MSNEQGYNGWSNYETWVVAVWLDNDYQQYLLWRDNAKQVIFQILTDDCQLLGNEQELLERAVRRLSVQLYTYIEDENPLKNQANAYIDLLNAALAEVDYLEIAQHWLDSDLVQAALHDWQNDSQDEQPE